MKDQILLKNVNLFDVEKSIFRNNLDVLIEDDIVKDVGKLNYVGRENLTLIDCSKKFALPGLFECHTHLSILTNQPVEVKKEILKECGIEENTQEDELEKEVLKDFVVKGITQVRDCGGPVKTLKDLKNKISKGEYTGPDIFYAGPMLEKSPLRGEKMNKRWPGWTIAVDSEQDAENIIDQIAEEGASLVKTFGKFDEVVLKYLLDRAKVHNLPVTHDPGPTFFHSIPMDRAIDLGIRCFEHGKSPWYVILKDDLKSEHDSLTDADPEAKQAFITKVTSLGSESISLTKLKQFIDKMLDYDVYFCPTLHVFKFYSEKPEVFSQEEPEKYKKIFEKLYEIGCVITKETIGQDVKILVGQDGYIPRFTLNEMHILRDLGLLESEIIKGATIYPSHWLGIADQLGSISPQKKANILILNKNPLDNIQNIKAVYMVLQNGRILFQEQSL